MLQIVKCKDHSCCKFRTNYLTYFPDRFLPPPIPLKSTVDGLEISEGKFGSLFQAICLAKHAEKCFDKFCPSLQKVDNKGKTTIEKHTCWKCGRYHSTIKSMISHKRTCDGYQDDSDDDGNEESDKDEENEGDFIEVQFIGDDEVYEVIYL